MAERTSYAPGTFSWVDLNTTDVEGAKTFYGDLLGWEPQDVPAGEGATYTMFARDGRHVAGMWALDEEQSEHGVPPFWLSYVTVEDADATAARAAELGGGVLAGPFDVLDAGRMAVLQDVQGGVLAVWQARQHIGAGVVNVHGALTWNDLSAADPEAAGRFYAELFGWTVERVAPDQPYWTVAAGGRPNGGIMQAQGGAPPAWNVYFAVDDLDAATAKATASGGAVVVGPMDVPGGRFVALRDPQGAFFSVFAGEFDD